MQQDAVSTPLVNKRQTKRGQTWREMVKNRWAYAFISPFYILFAIFALFPVAFSIYLSVHEWTGYGPMEYVGLKNFAFAFKLGGAVFWKSIVNGVLLFFMYVPLMMLAAILLAVILNSRAVRFFQAYRTMVYAPRVTSMVAAGIVFRLMFEAQGGLFNLILGALGLPAVPWLEHIWWARVALCILVVWAWLGQNMVYMLAGLQTISSELTEAAKIDGANSTQTLFQITIPLLRPVILFATILSTMGSFGLFAETMTLTWGGRPMRATLTTIVHLYNVAFGDHKFGRASALSYIYFALIFVLSILQFRRFGRDM